MSFLLFLTLLKLHKPAQNTKVMPQPHQAPSKLKSLASNLTASQHNHNTQYSVYSGPIGPKFGKLTANR